MPPKVSVILCGYNQREYLVCAIESVLKQTCRDFELLIIDNASTDGSPEVLMSYEGRPNVRIFSYTENAAVTRRYNDAVALAKGEFISFLNADDYFLPGMLESQLAKFALLPPDYGVVYAPVRFLNVVNGHEWNGATPKSSGSILRELFDGFFTEGFVSFIGALIRRRCLLEFPFHEQVFFESEAIFFRLALRYKFFYLDEPSAVMREHLENAGKAIDRNYDNLDYLLEKLTHEDAFTPDLWPVLDRFRGAYARNLGWQSLRVTEDPARARAYFRKAVRWHPAQWRNFRTLLGLPMSFLPLPLLRGLNRMLSGVMRPNVNIVHRKDYGAG